MKAKRLLLILTALVLVLLLVVGTSIGVSCSLKEGQAAVTYAEKLFLQDRVHTVDLAIEDVAAFFDDAAEETYVPCTVTIDGETFSNVGVRAKGNNSLRLTEEYGLSRFSMKLEFDQYVSGGNYYGLDKFSLDSSFQDNSYLKTYLVYDLMSFMGVPSPLCSYTWVTINGVDWGLFLAIEEPEEAFLERNFGSDHGTLYKPDYTSLRAENADVDLRYLGENPALYPNIFDNAKTRVSVTDQARLIEALRILDTGERLEDAVDLDTVLSYFAAQVFVQNPDSYLGPTGHNYYLYEDHGKLSMLPWDYNLAFGTYCYGMTNPIRDPFVLVNYPVNTPWEGSVMLDRPLFHNVMSYRDCCSRYHERLWVLLSEYIDSGRMDTLLTETAALIRPYVERDASAFCTVSDFDAAVETLRSFCTLRAESIRGQLTGSYPITLKERAETPESGVDVGTLDLLALGDFDDLEQAKERQDAARTAVEAGS